MNNITRPALYSVSSHQGFADSVAAYFISQYGRGPLSLADGLILLPNNRAVNAIEEAFIRHAGKGLLLPRMVTIGDLDLHEKSGIFIDQFDQEGILPAINPMCRTMILAKLIEQYHTQIMKSDIDSAHSVKLAMELSNALDQLDVEEIDFSRFEDLPSKAEMAEHWQKSYALFEAVYSQYRQKLLALKLSTMVLRRNALIRNMVNNLDQLSHHPFVAAIGITTAAPAIAYLLRHIARCQNGMIVLPHIDQMMAEDVWQGLGPHEKQEGVIRAAPSLESHPQFHLKLLLDKMGFDRSEVTPLGGSKTTKISDRKDQLVSHIFAPAKQTAQWQSIEVNTADFKHLKVMTAPDSAAEAQAVAILVRKNLEMASKRIAIVTPDRELARRISAHLLRWNIKADDSAGIALQDTPSGSLFLLIAEMCANGFAPIDLLKVLKHPLVRKGEERLAWLEKIRSLDLVLRGPRAGQGLNIVEKSIQNMLSHLKRRGHYNEEKQAKYDELLIWWQEIRNCFETIVSINSSNEILMQMRYIADFLCGEEIWKGDAGRSLSDFYTETLSYIEQGPSALDIVIFPQFLRNLMDGIAVRSPYGNHPRVAIYGLLEARLQRSDMIICAGLNEGSWPQKPSPDPWLAPGIRRDLALPSLERNIGLSAHDLAEAIGAKEVVLSRSERDSGGPAVTSRFMLRLIAFAGDKLKYDDDIAQWVDAIDKPQHIKPAVPPMPKPNKKQRHIRLNVTDMDKIKADPFAFYASKIMGFGKLDEIDGEASAAWRGTMIHNILEKWVSEDHLNPEKLMARAEALLNDDALHPTERMFWQPRLLEQIHWIAQQSQSLIDQDKRKILAVEASGTYDIEGITIKGMADRIDRLADGRLAIIDYKSGGHPSLKQIKSGFALQLGLLGLLAEKEAFSGMDEQKITGTCGAFEYWTFQKNSKDKSFGKIWPATLDELSEKKALTHIATEDMVALSHEHSAEAIRSYILGDAPFEAQRHPEYAPYNDYAHLSRLMEWYGRIANGETDNNIGEDI